MTYTLTAEERAAVELAAANISQAQRDKYQSAGDSMPSGAFPIPTVGFLRKAIMSFGRCRPDQRDALVAHIRDRAKALGALDLPWVANFLASHGAGPDQNNTSKPMGAKG